MNVRREQEPDDSAKGESWPTRRRRHQRFGQHDKGEKQQWREAKTFRNDSAVLRWLGCCQNRSGGR